MQQPQQKSFKARPAVGLAAALVLAGLGAACESGKVGAAGARAGAGGGSFAGGGAVPPMGGAGGDVAMPPPPFEPLPPRAYAAKAKDLLTGLPLTDAELQAVTSDPGALSALIDDWMKRPEYRSRMMDFLPRAFQQTDIDITDFEDSLRAASGGWNRADQLKFVASAKESFARTMLALDEAGRPFTDAVTTTRFALNVPLMVALAYQDAAPLDDDLQALAKGFWLLSKYPALKVVQRPVEAVVADGGVAPPGGTPDGGVAPSREAIPPAQSLDPASPNFMVWTATRPVNATATQCASPTTTTGPATMNVILRYLFGGRTDNCSGTASVFTDQDWNTWRLVTIRAPRAGEERTTFFDLKTLRDPTTTELVLATPRVGFMTTPAFFANWPTNDSNSYRVTINQTLIVALGRSFDDRGTTVQVQESTSDAQHVTPGTPCYGCHVTLDPMRDFFRQSYALSYSQQLGGPVKKPVVPPASAAFTVDGSPVVMGQGVSALAQALANHPSFAPAWVRKVCQWANAAPCAEDDPEVARVAGVFASGGYAWKTLVRETLASPLVTFAARTATAEAAGVTLSIARRDAFCARLDRRLGLTDVCNAAGVSSLPATAGRARNLSMGIPGGGYARGEVDSVLPHDPNLFFVAGTEKLCGLIAGALIDVGAKSLWTSVNKDAAIEDFVTKVIGLPPSDARQAAVRAALQKHYTAALAAKEKAADALRSTFTLACSSPLFVSSGL